MASVNATAVALEVVEMVQKGQKVNHRSLLKKHGYSDSVSLKPNKVTKTKSYMDIVNPAIKRMEAIRAKALKSLDNKDYEGEKIPVLLSTVDILTKNAQLLGGKATENIGINIEISEAIANKYQDVSSKLDDTKNMSNEG